MGLDPELVLDRFLKGSILLLSIGGGGLLVMGADGQPQEMDMNALSGAPYEAGPNALTGPEYEYQGTALNPL